MFRQAGIIRVDSLEDLVATAAMYAHTGPIPGRRLGVAGASGGACDIIGDRAEQEGIELPDFADSTRAALEELLPEYGTAHNPLDVTGAVIANTTLLSDATTAIANDPGVDVVITQFELARSHEPARFEPMLHITEALKASPVPALFVQTVARSFGDVARELVIEHGMPVAVGGIELSMRALGKLMTWSELERTRAAVTGAAATSPVPVPDLERRRGAWSEQRAREMLAAAGIPVIPGEMVADADGALVAAARFGYPVALKTVAPELQHKSDVGAVRLGLADNEGLRAALADMDARMRALSPAPTVEGFLVSPMRAGGVELLLGVVHDPVWGQVLALGLGGVWTEIFADVSLRILPITTADVRAMLGELKGTALLRGARAARRPLISIVSSTS